MPARSAEPTNVRTWHTRSGSPRRSKRTLDRNPNVAPGANAAFVVNSVASTRRFRTDRFPNKTSWSIVTLHGHAAGRAAAQGDLNVRNGDVVMIKGAGGVVAHAVLLPAGPA